MDKDAVKRIFFELLNNDEDFQKKLTEFILNAVAEKFVERVAQVEEPPQSAVEEPEVEQKNSTEEFAENAAKLLDECDKLNGQQATVESQRDDLQADLNNLRAEKASVEGQRDKLQADLNNLRAEKASVESQLATVRNEKATVESQRDKLQVDLAERFADGWELYKKFLSLEASARKDSGLYAENFEAFICSGAQMKRLEGIWESALDSKRAGKIACAEIFWEVFAYCVRLVNAAQGDNIIEILNTQIGERYDTDKHSTSGTNSSTQGVVREIILTGYRNNISRKIVRKSNVRVG